MDNFFCCPKDKARVSPTDKGYFCEVCGENYPIEGDVPVFNNVRGYWSNVSRSTMNVVIERTRNRESWRKVVAEEIPLYERHIAPLFRGDIRVAIPINNESLVLDAGSMWGGVSIPLAPFCKKLYALDQTWESLQFLSERAKQDSYTNIETVEGSVKELPFIDNTFDLVILNGVLEWLATEDEVILERDWENPTSNNREDHELKHPTEMQLQGLKEIYRVLNNNGSIYLAIENRIGLQYLAGYPDDHVNIRFVSFLPRRIANFVTKIIKNHSYRTYLYSPNKLARLLKSAGFNNIEIYSSAPHYNIISRLIPFKDFSSLKEIATTGGAPLDISGKLKVAIFGIVWSLIPSFIGKHLCPSVSIVASKSEKILPSLIEFLYRHNLLNYGDYGVSIINNRFDDHIPMNCIVRNRDTQKVEFFCKVARMRDTKNLNYESDRLIEVSKYLGGSSLEASVPKIIFSGNMDGTEIQITKYRHLKNIEPRLLSNILKHSKQKYIKWISMLGLMSFIRKLYFVKIMKATILSCKWLSKFQQLSIKSLNNSKVNLYQFLYSEIELINVEKQRKELVRQALDDLDLSDVYIDCVDEHGDFDYCNLFFDNSGSVFVVDFEHTENYKLPFFDLGTLLFSNLVTEWLNLNSSISLSEFAYKSGWNKIIRKCLKIYSDSSGISMEVLRSLPLFVAMRQFSKEFPISRNPEDYPLYNLDVFDEMLSWRLDL